MVLKWSSHGEMMHHLKTLIIEDESLLALELAETVKSLGYEVAGYATTSSMAKEYLKTQAVDLLLMDINLNEPIDGIDLYRQLKTEAPVIYLTAYKDEETINKAITTDPLGYLVKPINLDELNAVLKLAAYKIQNRPESTPNANRLAIGGAYTFDMDEEKLFDGDTFISLSQNELKLLKLLIDAKGQFMTFTTLENEIWRDKIVSDSALRTLIYRLRSKLKYDLIENKFNYGVRLP